MKSLLAALGIMTLLVFAGCSSTDSTEEDSSLLDSILESNETITTSDGVVLEADEIPSVEDPEYPPSYYEDTE